MFKINHDYHIVELSRHLPKEVHEWLFEKLGQPNDHRWFIRNKKIYFLNEKDHLMFLLRWA